MKRYTVILMTCYIKHLDSSHHAFPLLDDFESASTRLPPCAEVRLNVWTHVLLIQHAHAAVKRFQFLLVLAAELINLPPELQWNTTVTQEFSRQWQPTPSHIEASYKKKKKAEGWCTAEQCHRTGFILLWRELLSGRTALIAHIWLTYAMVYVHILLLLLLQRQDVRMRLTNRKIQFNEKMTATTGSSSV